MRVGELGGALGGHGGGGTQVFMYIYRWKAERALAYVTYRIDMNLIR